jgi:L-ascorbate metabolism protein UlaG (beta-lactamase superfamily)
LPKADLILVTHDHTDHFSAGDIEKIMKPSTVIVSIRSVIEDLPDEVKVSRTVAPGDTVTVNGILIEAVPAYNIEKKFHPREKGYVGFVIHLKDRRVYHAGDTDLIPEMEQIEAEVALLPIGGKFTMDPVEAAKAAEIINPEVAIPMHWGRIIGTWEDAKQFQAMCKTRVVVLPELDHGSEE